MMTVAEWKRALNAGKLDEKLKQLYGSDAAVMAHQKKRYTEALEEFAKLYPERKQVSIFSAPGRTEVGGNHTDHQHGCVLAAAVNLDVIAVVDPLVSQISSDHFEEFLSAPYTELFRYLREEKQ